MYLLLFLFDVGFRIEFIFIFQSPDKNLSHAASASPTKSPAAAGKS